MAIPLPPDTAVSCSENKSRKRGSQAAERYERGMPGDPGAGREAAHLAVASNQQGDGISAVQVRAVVPSGCGCTKQAAAPKWSGGAERTPAAISNGSSTASQAATACAGGAKSGTKRKYEASPIDPVTASPWTAAALAESMEGAKHTEACASKREAEDAGSDLDTGSGLPKEGCSSRSFSALRKRHLPMASAATSAASST